MRGGIDQDALLERLSAQLETAGSQRQILELVAAEIRNTLGYRSTWLAVLTANRSAFRVLMAELSGGDDLWDSSTAIPVEGDAFAQRVIESDVPEVVEDARRSDEVNREFVEQFGVRTIITVPIVLGGEHFGALCTGTFGDEGPRLPSVGELDYLERLGAIAGAELSHRLRLAGHI